MGGGGATQIAYVSTEGLWAMGLGPKGPRGKRPNSADELRCVGGLQPALTTYDLRLPAYHLVSGFRIRVRFFHALPGPG